MIDTAKNLINQTIYILEVEDMAYVDKQIYTNKVGTMSINKGISDFLIRYFDDFYFISRDTKITYHSKETHQSYFYENKI